MVDVAFKNDKIIPDVVDEAPNKLVSVSDFWSKTMFSQKFIYTSDFAGFFFVKVNWVEANVSADLGNEITPRQV